MIVENNIIFKDEDAGNAESPRFANDRNVAEQATVGARRVDPVRRDLRAISVERRKTAHRLNAVSSICAARDASAPTFDRG
jgi:hypothetical protein